MNECFLCSGTEQPLARFCECNMVAHHDCMARTIQCVHSHKEGCPVCQRSYRTKVEKKRLIVLRCHHVLSVDASIALICLADFMTFQEAATSSSLVPLLVLMSTATLGLMIWSMTIRCQMYPRYGALFPLCVETQEEIILLQPERGVDGVVRQYV